jgi:integrase
MPGEGTRPKGRRRHNGKGTISGPRKDGRYVGAFYAPTTAGTYKRVYVYGRTWEQARDRVVEEQSKIVRGIPVAAESWKVGPYLDYWLETVVKASRRPATYALYETIIRLYLKPGLGHHRLRRLSLPIVQAFFNAKLGELPAGAPGDVHPWSVEETLAFLRAARTDLLYPAFILLIIYGMRRGEVLGLCWRDVDLDTGTLRVRQQLQRVNHGLHQGPVKTRAGQRDLPIPALVRTALLLRKEQQAVDREVFGRAWTDTGLVFTTRSGLPVEPRNLARSFRRICERRKIRVIKVHHLRHTTASLLKRLNVPARDAEIILGHAHISTTMQIYTHVDEESRAEAITSLDRLLDHG